MSQNQQVTIQDIADKANVSISTVSRVLNGNVRVAEAKKSAVLAAVEELNYQPNIFAQGLARGQSKTIGVITQNVGGSVYDTMLRGILQALDGSGYSPLCADGRWQAQQEQKAIQLLLSRRIDGLIVMGGNSSESWLCQIGEEIPLIVVARSLSSLSEQCLTMDDFQGAYTATRYLIQIGHYSIAHITGILARQDAQARYEGYQQALLEHDIVPEPALTIEGDFTEQSGVMAVEMLLNRGRTFSAIFAANDQMAVGARLALFRRGLRVPDDVSLVGFDDQHGSAYTTPPLTTIQVPAVALGEAAVNALLHKIANKPYVIPDFPAELILRESVARYR